MSKKRSRGRPSLRSIAARKGHATRRANLLAAKRRASALKGVATRRRNAAAKAAAALKAKRSKAARKGHATRRANARERSKPIGAPQGTGDFAEGPQPPRESAGGFQSGGIYGGYIEREEPAFIDFDGWDFDDLDGLDSEADDDGDTGGTSAKT